MSKYEPKIVEEKWRKVWRETGLYKTPENPKNPYYGLVMFAYPSGDLHCGHWYPYTGGDILARFARMQGHDVLHTNGFDAFGLPAENAAIKRGLMADVWTEENISTMTRQYEATGNMYDYDRLINTSKPEYYKWTQWLFLQLYKNGKAYQKEALVNWDPVDKTVLANEQVINGRAERSGAEVEKKSLKQWFFKITDYADALLEGLDNIEWPNRIKDAQKNWIGKSHGSLVKFTIKDSNDFLEIYTTRIDTIYSGTFIVLAPEHELVTSLTVDSQKQEVVKYQEISQSKTDTVRLEGKDKSGVFTGSYALNPATNESMPIWVADFVLGGYGTGAVFADAHDQRDSEFAKKYNIPLKTSVKPVDDRDISKIESFEICFEDDGILYNSEHFDGLTSSEAREKITEYLGSKGLAQKTTQYRLRDWLISRQRYWGSPIPIIYCEKCGTVPVPEKDLPVVLPLAQKIDKSGKSPLYRDSFINTECPECGGQAKRETDTMDTFVDSSWYYLRYPNPHYDKGPFDPEALNKWLPVSTYIGGPEHATMHLLYVRFMAHFLNEAGFLETNEPIPRFICNGLIDGPDGQKMSKSRGNVVDPDEYVNKYGADSVRLYMMFMGSYTDGGPWDPARFEGASRFISRFYELVHSDYKPQEINTIQEVELQSRSHKLVKKLKEDIAVAKFNTAIAAAMEFVNFASQIKRGGVVSEASWKEAVSMLVLSMAPITPYVCEELWQTLGGQESVHKQAWPRYDEKLVTDDVVTIVVQVNGKLKNEFVAEIGTANEELEKIARGLDAINKIIQKGEIIKVVVVPNRLVNFVIKQ